MENFISTQTAILLSFLLKKMPNLFRHILECSKEFNVNHPVSENILAAILTTQQIQEARMHPNTIVLNSLDTLSAVQSALISTDKKLENLLHQRNKIENILVKLITISKENSEKKEG